MRRADRVAAALGARGVGPDRLVGVHLGPSIDLVASVLGVWLAGGAFVPLDPAHPAERLRAVSADADLYALITPDERAALGMGVRARHTLAPVGGTEDDEPPPGKANLDAEPPPDRLAYVIYTSGTTGVPKGVEIEQRSLTNLASAVAEIFGPDAGDCLSVMSPAFDGWIWSTMLPLAHGRAVVLRDGRAVAAGQERVTASTATCTPSFLATAGEALRDVRTLVLAGEHCPPGLVDAWREGRRLINAYGPTETTICATWADSARGDDPRTIGRPLPGVRAYVLDADLRPVPPGGTGELFIGGAAVGRGYRDAPEETAGRFLDDPIAADGRVYRSGDLVRQRPDGRFEFLGRADSQVKVRGFRVELAEIERVALGVEGVSAAAAFPMTDGEALGLAVVPTSTSGGPASTGGVAGPDPLAAVRVRLARTLPDYICPATVLAVPALELTPAGKVDRRALAELAERAAAAAERAGPPCATDTERRLAVLWSEILDRPVEHADQNFFEAGGHSLLVARMVARLRREWGVHTTIGQLIANPTVAAFAAQLDRAGAVPAQTAAETGGGAR